MVIIGLDDKEYSLSLAKYSKSRPRCSALHKQARDLLHQLVGNINIFEEVPLLGTTKPPVIADFLIPDLKLLVETQGQQHYEQNSLFHNDSLDFRKGQARDRLKVSWAEVNGFKLVALKYNEIDDWASQIKSAFAKD